MAADILRVTECLDGDASLLGRFGLRDALTAWLISRGHSDFVGMLPSEIERYQSKAPPRCPAVHRGGRCNMLMKSRGLDWVCYFHKKPYRMRDEPLQPLYAQGRIEENLRDIVDIRFARGAWLTVKEPF